MTATLPVQQIRNKEHNAAERQQLFEALYETAFPAVARFVQKMGGDYEEASDIFQDAVVVFYEKYTENELTIHSSFRGYLLGIAKHLWVRKFQKDRFVVSFDDFEQQLDVPTDDAPALSVQRMLLLLERSGQKCLVLLKAFYYDKLSMAKIKNLFGYGSERSATVQKYKCVEKLRNEVKTKELTYEDFFE